jgi:hypothetical protein
MSELIPKDIPKGKVIVQEGMKIGQTFEMGKNAFLEHRNVRTESDWKRQQAEKGIIQWSPIMGLSTIEEQVEGIKYLWEWGKERGIEVDRCLHISSMLNGVPLELRHKCPKPTSFLLEDTDDFNRIAQAAPIQPVFDDHMISGLNSVNNAINCLKAGCNDIGTICQFVWDYPYCHDEVAQIVEVVKSIGIVSSKRKNGAFLLSYLGDGIPGQFLDHVSEIGYSLLEKYIVDELCGAAYVGSLGGVHSHIPGKLATWLALHDVLKSEDHCSVSFYQGNTLEVTEDLESNYGLVVADFIPFAILERKYKTGVAYMPNPVTECIRVPTISEIIDVLSACVVALKKALELEEANLIDDSYINKLRAILVEKGQQWFKNALSGLSELGIDIRDPIQILLSMRRLGGRQLEEKFHPGERDSFRLRGITPYVPTDLITKPMQDLEKNIERIRAEQLTDVVKGKKFFLCSTDTHEYGLFVVNEVLKEFGASIVNAGVDLDAEQILNIACEEDGTCNIAVSTHNGLSLDWSKRLMEVARDKKQIVNVFIGGRLNAIVEGVTEPINVTEQLSDLGLIPCEDMIDFFRMCSKPDISRRL